MSQTSKIVLSRFRNNLANDKKLRQLANKIRGSTNFNDANEFAVRSGEILHDQLLFETERGIMTPQEIPEIMWDTMSETYEMVTAEAAQIQNNLNAASGVGLEAKVPQLDAARLQRIVDKIYYGELDPAQESIINFAQSLVDEGIKENVKANAAVGLKPRIIRKAEASGTRHRIIKRGSKSYSYPYQVPCKWCRSLEGTYDYEDVHSGDDVFRRHVGCRCEVTYINDTKAQDVWSKIEWTYNDTQSQIEAVAEKERERAEELRRLEAARDERTRTVQTLIDKYKMSAKRASIFYNMNKDLISKYGIDYAIRSV